MGDKIYWVYFHCLWTPSLLCGALSRDLLLTYITSFRSGWLLSVSTFFFIFNYMQAPLENSPVACECEEKIQVEPLCMQRFKSATMQTLLRSESKRGSIKGSWCQTAEREQLAQLRRVFPVLCLGCLLVGNSSGDPEIPPVSGNLHPLLPY